MSKERELLKRVRDTLRELKETHYDLYWDIKAELDLAPPKREPLSDEEIFNIGYNAGFTLDHVENDDDDCSSYGFLNEYGYIDNNPYFKFVRAIEKAHGIGVENE
jgi:hypothetical protein